MKIPAVEFSVDAFRLLSKAQKFARRYQHTELDTVVLTLGAVSCRRCTCRGPLRKARVPLRSVRRRLADLCAQGSGDPPMLPFSSKVRHAFEQARRVATRVDHPYLDSRHIVLGVLATDQDLAGILDGDGILEGTLLDDLRGPLERSSRMPTAERNPWNEVEIEDEVVRVFMTSRRVAIQRGLRTIDLDCLVIGVLETPDTVAQALVLQHAIDPDGAPVMASAPLPSTSPPEHAEALPFTEEAKKVLDRAFAIAQNEQPPVQLSTLHILRALEGGNAGLS